jgi:hypothetical protein
MHHETERRLKEEASRFFDGLHPEQRAPIEAMYQAFKARLICELRVQGSANMGVVSGDLEERPQFPPVR